MQVGMLHLLLPMANEWMNVFEHLGPDQATQRWIADRYMAAACFDLVVVLRFFIQLTLLAFYFNLQGGGRSREMLSQWEYSLFKQAGNQPCELPLV